MHCSYPRIPRFYCLPKIHKPGFIPIASNINAPTYNVAKWLCKRFSELESFDTFSIKNSFELVECMKNISLDNDEILVSFDITAYYPSVPVDKALFTLRT